MQSDKKNKPEGKLTNSAKSNFPHFCHEKTSRKVQHAYIGQMGSSGSIEPILPSFNSRAHYYEENILSEFQ